MTVTERTLRDTLLAIKKLRARISDLEQCRAEPIAIIGLGCRFPGAAGEQAYWQLIRDGGDAIREVPADRWDIHAFYDPDPDAPGKMATRYGGFLEAVDQFDCDFFGIAPREAASLDPQQRLVLEVAWEALENACVPPDRLLGSRTAVFLGMSNSDYWQLLTSRGPSAVDAYQATGNGHCVAAGRLSYLLGLQGPSVSVDTACSSSLVAVSQACQSLLTRQCDLALTGGVNAILFPELTIIFSKARMLSADGRCKAFDAAADGYVRGEGCGIVVLKRLSDAQRDGDAIRAVIRGVAVNQDGRSSGLTVPNGPAQQSVVREALAMAGLSEGEVQYVEAHGTGTALGDPIEVQALAAVLGAGRSANQPLLIGSVKTNIGHLEAAAGIAGLIKVVLALEHGEIPPSLHCQRLNPAIPWDKLPVQVVREKSLWPAGPGRRIAGISSFGYSGTNAHVVLEDARESNNGAANQVHPRPLRADPDTQQPIAADRLIRVLTLSARNPAALRDLADRYAAWLREHTEADLADVCYTANAGRSHFEHRLALVASSREQVLSQLTALAKGETTAEHLGSARGQPKVAFLFSGQGSEYPGMGRELFDTEPVFRAALERCAEGLRGDLDQPLFEVLWHQERLLKQPAYLLPALFAVDYALAELWRSWGIMPQIVLGPNVGTYVAACVAEVFSPEEGLRLVVRCGRRLQALAAGDSSTEESLCQEVEMYSRGVTYHAPRVSLLNAAGRIVTAAELRDAAFWRDEPRQAEDRARSMATLAGLGFGLVLEMGPALALGGTAQGRGPRDDLVPVLVPTLCQGHGDRAQLAAAMAQLYVRGATADFVGFHQHRRPRKLSLPTYPFQRQRCWFEKLPSVDAGALHPLLGQRRLSASGEVVHAMSLGCENYPYLSDHRVFQSIVVPGATFAAMALCAAGLPCQIRDLSFLKPLPLDAAGRCEAQLVFAPSKDGTVRRFEVFSAAERNGEGKWSLHAHGTIESIHARPAEREPLDALRARLRPRSPEELFASLAALGLELGPAFRAIQSLWVGPREAFAELILPPSLAQVQSDLPAHPALLDACTQLLGAVQNAHAAADVLMLPLRYERLELMTSLPLRFFCHLRLRPDITPGGETLTADLHLLDPGGLRLGELQGFVAKRAPREAWSRSLRPDVSSLLYEIQWQEKTSAAQKLVSGEIASASELPGRAGTWLVFADVGGLGSALATRLSARMQRCVVIEVGVDFAEHSSNRFTVAPSNPEDFDRLLEAVLAGDQPPLRGVVYLWGVDASTLVVVDPSAEAQRLLGGLLHVAQALLRRGQEKLDGLWLLTRGAQAVRAGSPVTALSAALWGAGRTLAVEHPQMHCTLLDVDAQFTAEASALEQIAGELLSSAAETESAWRDGKRLVPRLRRLRRSPSYGLRELLPHATYLITGGLGALGLETAQWLVQRGARYVVLTSRRPPTATALETIARLQAAGADIRVIQADVSHASEVQRLLGLIRESMPPLRGVIHAAGVLDDGAITEQSWERVAAVLAPKVLGAWHLHEQTQDRPLDFFVLYSSVAAVIGSPGQGAYAAGNSFLDALAHQRRGMGLPGLSVNWGPWAERGIAANSALGRRRWQQQGIELSPAATALAALGEILDSDVAQATVLSVDWSRYVSGLGPSGPQPHLSDLLKDLPAPLQGKSELLDRLREAAPAEREELLAEHVQAEVRRALGLTSAPDAERGFFEMGMDSLMTLELRNRLQSQLGDAYVLPSTLAFDFPTITALAKYLSNRLLTLPQSLRSPRQRRAYEAQPIAIVGLSCRFPGAPDAESYWQMLRDGVDAIREVPADRWDIDAYYDPDPAAPGKMSTRHGGFLDRVDCFDAHFFGIAPLEMISLDPQQRLLLETAWEAFEHAGLSPEKLHGSRAGVYLGMSSNDYFQLLIDRGIPNIDAYMGTGNSVSAAAGRLSYVFGLQGPSFVVDTACSSSLVALHQACQGLLMGDCDLALVGGVNVLASPVSTIFFSKARMMAPDGRCKSFDASADGYVRSEGCGIIIVKRLADAQRDGDRVLALIRGSAVNQDGRSGGLTVPNGPAQERVICEALEMGSIEPAAVHYVEAHGTGTALGDPIEVQSLAAVFGEGRLADSPLLIGSVKTNIGHLEAAAGIAGLIKIVLAMQYGEIPPHLHFKVPSPHIPWDKLPVKVTSKRTVWPEGRRLAGLSAFAFQGTNAHVVLEEAPPTSPGPTASSSFSQPRQPDRVTHVLTLSAKSPAALRALAERYATWLQDHPGANLADVCFTANTGRSHFDHRLALVITSPEEARVQLSALARGHAFTGRMGETRGKPKLAFLFSGQGLQYPAMGRELFATEPVFRAALEHCAEWLRADLHRPFLEVLWYDEHLVGQPAYLQPALFAVDYALAELWRSWGITPQVVLGADVGAYVAACVAGVFSPEEGLRLVARRGRMLQAVDVTAQQLLRMEFERYAGEIIYHPARLRLLSAVGVLGEGQGMQDAAYWRDEVQQKVNPGKSVETLVETGCALVMRMGPAPALRAPAQGCSPRDQDAPVLVPTLCQGQSDSERMAEALACLYVHGITPDFVGVDQPWQRCKISLPTYPFQRQRYWVETKPRLRPAADSQTISPLLGKRHRSASGELVYTTHLGGDSQPFLTDHRVFDKVLVPGAWYAAAALSAVGSPARLQELIIPEALILEGNSPRMVQLVFSSLPSNGSQRFEVFSSEDHTADGKWTLHARGTVQRVDAPAPEREALDELRARLQSQPVQSLYDSFARWGMEYGAAFRGIQELWAGPGEALGVLTLPSALAEADSKSGVHPVLLDACFQVVGGCERPASAEGALYVPVRIEELELFAPLPRRFYCHAQLRSQTMPGADTSTADLRLLSEDGWRLGIIKGFMAKRVEPATFWRDVPSPVQDWFYGTQWCERARAQEADTAAELSGTWLILSDGGYLATRLSKRLQEKQQRCVLVELGADFRLAGHDRYRVPPATAAAFDRLLDDALPAGVPLCGVIHLRGLDAVSNPAGTAEQVLADMQDICGSALHLVQALVRRQLRPASGFWLLTRSAQAVGENAVSAPILASLWGLGRVIAMEHPELKCRLLDLDPQCPDSEVDDLLQELLAPDAEDQAAFRSHVRHVPRLVRMALARPSEAPPVRGDAAYLITGGLGGLGLEVARWLVRRGARYVALMGRRPPTETAQATIGELRAAGCHVGVLLGDVSREADVRRALAEMKTTLPPLRGVVHCAGILDDGALVNQNWDRFATVLAPKVQGAWHLHRHTEGYELDLFVLFSSLASVLGSAGQANYAVANAFLDALAQLRRAAGLPGIAINWGPWSRVGAAARGDLPTRFVALGIGMIAPAQGLEALEQVVCAAPVQISVVPIDRAVFARKFHDRGAGPPRFLAELVHTYVPAPGSTMHAHQELLGLLEKAGPDQRLQLMIAFVQQIAEQTMRLEKGILDTAQDLQRHGLDSLMAMALRGSLASALGQELPATLLFDYSTPAAIADYLLGNVLKLGPRAPGENGREDAKDGDPGVEAELQSLSTGEIASLLDAELAAVRGDRP